MKSRVASILNAKHSRLLPVLGVILFAGIGAYIISFSRAATPTSSVELENATLSPDVKQVSDATASGGTAIVFGQKQQGFVHPGILTNKGQLDFVKAKLAANQQPWVGGYAKFYSWSKTPGAIKDGVAIPYPTSDLILDCSANGTACRSIVNDSIAAYTQALMYYHKGDRAAGQNAVKILNTWSQRLKGHNGTQAKLQIAWSAEIAVRAAEIMRHTYTPASGEVAFNVTAYSSMLQNVYKPAMIAGTPAASSSNGNWDLSFINGTMNIAVFTDDRALFDDVVSRWRARVPAYIYVSSDGTKPVSPPGGLYDDPAKLRCFWLAAGSPTTSCTVPAGFTYAQGMTQELCRDMSHVVSGLSSMVAAAETARIQGVDLYKEQQARIVAGFEYTAKYYETFLTTGSWPSAPCGRAPTGGEGGTNSRQGWEIGYNAYKNRLGVAMPETIKMINRFRATGAANQFAWETLTHAGN